MENSLNNKEQETQTSIEPTNSSDSLNKSVIAYFNQPDKSIYILTDFKYKKKLITLTGRYTTSYASLFDLASQIRFQILTRVSKMRETAKKGSSSLCYYWFI